MCDRTRTSMPAAGKSPPMNVQRNNIRGYAVSADGERLLMFRYPTSAAEVGQSEIDIVLNWTEELKQLVPTE